MTYAESKKKIDNIRQEYGCKGEIIFRSALPIVVEVGQCTILDEAWYQCEIDDIDTRHDVAEKEGKMLFVTRDFEKAILECAKELAQIDVHDLLVYIQKEVWLGDDGISYERAIRLVKHCIDWFTCDEELKDAYSDLVSGVGFDSEELEELGYGYLLDVAEEED